MKSTLPPSSNFESDSGGRPQRGSHGHRIGSVICGREVCDLATSRSFCESAGCPTPALAPVGSTEDFAKVLLEAVRHQALRSRLLLLGPAPKGFTRGPRAAAVVTAVSRRAGLHQAHCVCPPPVIDAEGARCASATSALHRHGSNLQIRRSSFTELKQQNMLLHVRYAMTSLPAASVTGALNISGA